jgi:zinc protease
MKRVMLSPQGHLNIMYRKNYLILPFAMMLGLATALVWADEQKVYEYTLGNGMKVVVQPDHRAPVAVSQVWYKVGSSNEHSGITGVSHVLEHMMFKGTAQYPDGRFSAIIAENGGQENAFTGRDYTAYYQFMGKERLEISFKLEADRMRNLSLPEEDFKKELEVVKEERMMRTEDNPQALTYERFNAVAYFNSPYHHPIIGWMEDLNALNVEDLRRWYDTWYQPNNATLVVVGDVEPKAVLELAKKHFGPIKPGKIGVTKPRLETPQRGERRVYVKATAKIPYLMMGYPVPVVNTAKEEWEPYALDVLASILDGGSSSRLSRNLVRGQEIASSVGASYSLSNQYQSLFVLTGSPALEKTLVELEKALLGEIKSLQSERVSNAELERVKAEVIAGDTYQLDSVQHLANQIGMLETVGVGWQLIDEYADKIKSVSAEQVREVAKKYLRDDHRTVAELKPQSAEKPGA